MVRILETRDCATPEAGAWYMQDLAGRLRDGGYSGCLTLDIEFRDTGRVAFTLRGDKPTREASE